MVFFSNLGWSDAIRTEAASQDILREELRRADPQLARIFEEAENEVNDEDDVLKEEKEEESSSEMLDKQDDGIIY